MNPFDLSTRLPASISYLLAPFLLIAAVLASVRFYTGVRYSRDIQAFVNASRKAGKQALSPPQIPYTLPWLGNTLDFLTDQPGGYWKKLFSWHPRSTGAFTILIGGRKTHIIDSPYAMQAIFRDRTMKRESFENDVYAKVLDMPPSQIQSVHDGLHLEKEMNAKYLSKFERVNELTSKFSEVLDALIESDLQQMSESHTFPFYSWLRNIMFIASTNALMGTKLLEMYPEYATDFIPFDKDFLSHFFGLPSFMMKEANRRREKLFTRISQWMAFTEQECGGVLVDPEGPSWEPLLGSRLNRARHMEFKRRGMDPRSSASLQVGLTFALASNVIPATGWMMMHILDPNGDPTLLPRVMSELRKAENEDGVIDVPTLVASPLLQALWTETLRLYTDVLITREASRNTTLPIDESGKTVINVQKGDYIFCPSWLGQHDPTSWSRDDANVNAFFPERHLAPDPENPTQQIFVAPKGNTLFAFGGGTSICPGRFFAKQEALGALATVLLHLEVDVLGYVDEAGKATEEFPGLASAFPGSGGLVPGGDMKVRVRRRERKDLS